MEKITLYLVPYKYGNEARMRGQKISTVTAVVGRKYFTVKGVAPVWDLRFYKEANEDENGVKFYDQVSDYTSDFHAYERFEDAENYLRRDALLTRIKSFVLDKLPLEVLSDINNILIDHEENVRKERRG